MLLYFIGYRESEDKIKEFLNMKSNYICEYGDKKWKEAEEDSTRKKFFLCKIQKKEASFITSLRQCH